MQISGVYKSITATLANMIDEIVATTGHHITYHSWESRSDEDKLPKHTLIGMDGFSFEENEGLWVVRFAIGISSFQDFNLLDEMDIIDIVHAWTGEKKKVKLLDPVTGAEVSELVVEAWRLMPMSQSELRNYRTIGVELLRTANHDY